LQQAVYFQSASRVGAEAANRGGNTEPQSVKSDTRIRGFSVGAFALVDVSPEKIATLTRRLVSAGERRQIKSPSIGIAPPLFDALGE